MEGGEGWEKQVTCLMFDTVDLNIKFQIPNSKWMTPSKVCGNWSDANQVAAVETKITTTPAVYKLMLPNETKRNTILLSSNMEFRYCILNGLHSKVDWKFCYKTAYEKHSSTITTTNLCIHLTECDMFGCSSHINIIVENLNARSVLLSGFWIFGL